MKHCYKQAHHMLQRTDRFSSRRFAQAFGLSANGPETMYCPNLDCPDYEKNGFPGEYVEDISKCPYCGSALVDQLPNPIITEDDDGTPYVGITKEGMQKLSSALTFIYKFVLPALWIGGLSLKTAAMFIASDSFNSRGDIAESRVLLMAHPVIV